MATTNKKKSKNPLQDQKWLKEFAEGLKKDIQKPKKQETPSASWGREITCAQKDIGKPNYWYSKKSSKK